MFFSGKNLAKALSQSRVAFDEALFLFLFNLLK